MDFAGRKVEVNLTDGSLVCGFVKCYSSQNGQLSLEKVELTDDGGKRKLPGLQSFFRNEIEKIVVLEDFSSNKGDIMPGQDQKKSGRSVLKHKVMPLHLQRLNAIEKQSLILKDHTNTECNEELQNGECTNDGVSTHTDIYTIINLIDNTFHEAVEEIGKYMVVAVAAEGVGIGRDGKLCWLQICIHDHVFLFDMLSLGKAAFEQGLKAILENEDILKVFHDCRLVSDMLHHQFNISIINVFDTQVASVFVYRLRHQNDWPRYTEGLASCLTVHLGLTKEDVNWALVRQDFKESDEAVWEERPMRHHVVDAAVKNVKYLVRLRQVLMEKMMEEYVAGVNIYLMHVRDANDADAKRLQTSSHLLPLAFTKIRCFMTSYLYQGDPYLPSDRTDKDLNGFHVNYNGIRPQKVARGKTEENISNSSLAQPADCTRQRINEVGLSEYPAHVAVPQSCPSANVSAQPQTRATEIREKPSMSLNEVVEARLAAQMSDSESIKESVRPGSQAVPASLQTLLAQKSQIAPDYGDLRGGSLMRALVFEQDTTGHERGDSVDDIHLVPAGKMLSTNVSSGNKKKKNVAGNNDDAAIINAALRGKVLQHDKYIASPRRIDRDMNCSPSKSQHAEHDQQFTQSGITCPQNHSPKQANVLQQMLEQRQSLKYRISENERNRTNNCSALVNHSNILGIGQGIHSLGRGLDVQGGPSLEKGLDVQGGPSLGRGLDVQGGPNLGRGLINVHSGSSPGREHLDIQRGPSPSDTLVIGRGHSVCESTQHLRSLGISKMSPAHNRVSQDRNVMRQGIHSHLQFPDTKVYANTSTSPEQQQLQKGGRLRAWLDTIN